MAEKAALTPELHREQIAKYSRQYPAFETYAKVLDRVLRNACRVSFPDALVQSRAKSLSSFAEKVARKFDKYPDAVNQMTDLCGARVLVQTTEQVKAVRRFIEANFRIIECDDKSEHLARGEFGYRDMHYIVELRDDHNGTLGLSEEEAATIGTRRAEIQVRTWVQHAWADTLHDRTYKNELTISSGIMRTGAILAAVLEEADRNFDLLADELDGLIANYAATTPMQKVGEEIGIQEFVLNNEPQSEKKPALSLKLARLYAACGDHARVVELLDPYKSQRDANRCQLLTELGHAICRIHRSEPSSPRYGEGLLLLQEALSICEQGTVPFVPHLRKHRALHARILSLLGWATEVIQSEANIARTFYHRAHEHEPANPYYLANMLGFEMYCLRSTDLPRSMRTTIREGIRTCRRHALEGTEMPYACFTAGRLSLLLEGTFDKDDPPADTAEVRRSDSLGYYARGIRHCLGGSYCVPSDVLDIEMEWVERLDFGKRASPAHKHVIDLIELGRSVGAQAEPSAAKAGFASPVLIIAGGADSMDDRKIGQVRPLIEMALSCSRGTVIAGGTTAGVPGCVGDVAGELARNNQKEFKLVGYRPENLPDGTSAHPGYDESVKVGSSIGPEQILKNWVDLLAAGIPPQDVLLLGFGGGDLSAVEYRVAIGLGASVGVAVGSGGTADELLSDELWAAQPKLYPMPMDVMAIRAFVMQRNEPIDGPALEKMAQAFHVHYCENNTKDLPANLKPWIELAESYRRANLEQAAYAVEILKAASLDVRPARDPENPVIFDSNDFTHREVELMARLEHGRWTVERLRDGWRPGPRDNDRKLHNCLVPWDELPDGAGGVRAFDRNAVRAFPAILAIASLEVYRRRG